MGAPEWVDEFPIQHGDVIPAIAMWSFLPEGIKGAKTLKSLLVVSIFGQKIVEMDPIWFILLMAEILHQLIGSLSHYL